ncbi:hypothetical protein IFM89_030963 [Coptis chinensis]|uniref:Uncharacterized protein n=1 Tax=Coptis chinensis TaxID=261450 RepID=A0A835IXW6_9MAGN|nr:hypothetical protein IFM89_030963 [Coptis chinensis]
MSCNNTELSQGHFGNIAMADFGALHEWSQFKMGLHMFMRIDEIQAALIKWVQVYVTASSSGDVGSGQIYVRMLVCVWKWKCTLVDAENVHIFALVHFAKERVNNVVSQTQERGPGAVAHSRCNAITSQKLPSNS